MIPGVAPCCTESPHSVSMGNTQIPLLRRVTRVIPETHCCSKEKNVYIHAHTIVVLDIYYVYEVACFKFGFYIVETIP